MKNLLICILVLSLLSCGQHTNKNNSNDFAKPVVYTTPAGDKIIFLEDYYRLYFKEIKTNYANRNRLYEQVVQDSIFNKFFTKSEYAEFVKQTLSAPIRDTADMGSYIASINTNHEKMEQIITAALAESRKYLKNDSVTIYIFPCNSDVKNKIEGMDGVSGFADGSKQVLLTVNPAISTWQEMLPYAIANQFNYTYWTKMNFKKATPTTLLDCLVSEGRADSYAHLIYPAIVAPWTKVMSDEVEATMWDKIKSQLKNQDIAFQYNVMFGSKSDFILWGGYTLGYHIVQSALKNHPELSPAEWTNLPPEKILEMSSYR